VPWAQSVLAYERTTVPQGALGFGTPVLADQKLKITVELTPPVSCEYGRGGLIGQVTNAAGAVESLLGITGFWIRTVPTSSTVCPFSMTEVARLKFLRPGNQNVYLSGAGG
jgi:hypothetical protein